MALQLITCAVWLERSGHGIIARRRSRGREGSAVADEDAMATLHGRSLDGHEYRWQWAIGPTRRSTNPNGTHGVGQSNRVYNGS